MIELIVFAFSNDKGASSVQRIISYCFYPKPKYKDIFL
jgi:hypothetical protein